MVGSDEVATDVLADLDTEEMGADIANVVLMVT